MTPADLFRDLVDQVRSVAQLGQVVAVDARHVLQALDREGLVCLVAILCVAVWNVRALQRRKQ